jgi:hypothetical protein
LLSFSSSMWDLTAAGARLRPCGRRRAFSLGLVLPPWPGARRSRFGPAGGAGPPPLSSFPLPRLAPAAGLPPPYSLLPPPSTHLRPRSDLAWAMRAAVEARALRWRPWRGGGRRMRGAAAGRRCSAGRGPFIARSTATIFFLMWHDDIAPFGARIVL